MKVNGGRVTVELDHNDIKHLMKGGTTQVSDPDADVSVSIKCRETLQFQVVEPEGDDDE